MLNYVHALQCTAASNAPADGVEQLRQLICLCMQADVKGFASYGLCHNIQMLVCQVFEHPLVLSAIAETLQQCIDNEADSAAAVLCDFILQLSFCQEQEAAAKVRSSDSVARILDIVCEKAPTGKASQAATPQARLQQVFAATQETHRELFGKTVQRWPGGRHRNDHPDFRMIQVLPTSDEITHRAPDPYLPTADGADEFLTDQVRGVTKLYCL